MATTAGTFTEAQLAHHRAMVLQLENKKAKEDAARAADSPAVRQLAVSLHALWCPEHQAGVLCTWDTVADANNAELADWTDPKHQEWLGIARTSLGVQLKLGFRVFEPGSSTPLPVPPGL